MKKLLLAVVAITGFIGQGTMATTELDMNDRPAMMQLADDLLRCVITFNFMALKTPDGDAVFDLPDELIDTFWDEV